jgi:hypothetical protein
MWKLNGIMFDSVPGLCDFPSAMTEISPVLQAGSQVRVRLDKITHALAVAIGEEVLRQPAKLQSIDTTGKTARYHCVWDTGCDYWFNREQLESAR